MESCKHMTKLNPARDHSVLNPQKWLCCVCGTTESVWACLSCSYVACGRYIAEHALSHYNETKHPLAIEVNEKYLYCYACEEYVLNDNAAGDIKILRGALYALATQSLYDVGRKGRRLLRSQSFTGFGNRLEAERYMRKEDLKFTALKFKRYYTLAKAYSAWKQYVASKKPIVANVQEPEPKCRKSPRLMEPKAFPTTFRRRPFVPGVTGLRNLGNTCYMNSILQVLSLVFSHLDDFREFFLSMKHEGSTADTSPERTAVAAELRSVSYTRQSTIECFQHINSGKKPTPEAGKRPGGLNGGASSHGLIIQKLEQVRQQRSHQFSRSLSEEMHALFRVLWSGRWAIVSPHKMLDAVWSIIPFFKGYSQQDAQEFLCELLDKVQSEIEKNPEILLKRPASISHGSFSEFMSTLFKGQLVSQVKCLRCGCKSETFEPFMDLSLEFPDIYHTQPTSSKTPKYCRVEEMLARFTETENLGQSYACEKCNANKSSSESKALTEAEKRFLVHKLPGVLRLHLKRFKWCGRNNRGKISTHVEFLSLLDMAKYCRSAAGASEQGTMYELTAVVMHHGRGFGSGHYTAYCWNKEAQSWIHCNDARMVNCSATDVMAAQAYILFYTQQRKDLNALQKLTASPVLPQLRKAAKGVSSKDSLEETADEEVVFNYKNSSIPKWVELKRKMPPGSSRGTPALKRSKTVRW